MFKGIFTNTGMPVIARDHDRQYEPISGNITFIIAPSPAVETHISKDETHACTIVSRARIDNIKELSDLLHTSLKEIQQLTISQLILRCYRLWGKDCVQKLVGDWAFAIYDNNKKELFLARDHYGHSSIYYYHCNDFFIFSTDLKEILSYDAVPKIVNESAIVQLSGVFKRDAQTFYKGIFQLPSAHTLSLHQEKLKLANYWVPEEFKPIRYSNDEDYVSHFLELYTEAVNCRIGSQRTGISLSSGFDSGSTAILAAPALASQNRKLEAFTWKTDLACAQGAFEGRTIDETPLVKTLVAAMPATNLHIVTSKEHNIIDVIKKNQEIFRQPTTPYVHVNELFEAAGEQGVEAMLTGFWGNFTISYTGDVNSYFRKLLFANPAGYIPEVLRWKANQYISWKGLFVNTFYKPLFKYRRSSPDKKKLKRDYFNAPALAKALQQYEPFTPALEQKRRVLKFPRSNLINAFQACAMGEIDTLANAYGLNVRTPVMDKRIIEFCWGIPNEQYIRKGYTKWLIKRAMKDKMPEEIIHAKKRGVQAADLLFKMTREAKEIQSLMMQLRRSPSASYWLDIDRIDLFLKQISSPACDLNTAFLKIAAIQRALALGIFLVKLEHG
jgi:asparagine synthase (glutamine-hydrolysing)